MTPVIDYALYDKLKQKLGDEETRALLDRFERNEALFEKKIEELKKEQITREILRYELNTALADQKWELMKTIFAMFLTFASIIIGLIFALFKYFMG